MSATPRPLVTRLAIAAGVMLFGVAVYNTDFRPVLEEPRRVAAAFIAAIIVSGAWHLIRTWMWQICFRDPPGLSHLARVRIAAEAFSYLTIRGVAGEPLKCVLLRGERSAAETAAAIAIEKVAYLIGTAAALAVASMAVVGTLTLSPAWTTTFRILAIVMAIAVIALVAATRRRGGTALPRLRRWLFIDAGDQVSGYGRRSMALALATLGAFACMVAEVWVVLRIAGIPVTWTEAVAIESVSRAASFAFAVVPANLGVLEVSTLSAMLAVGAGAGAAPLAIARRLRGLFWAAVGLALYPRGTHRDHADEHYGAASHAGRTLLYVASTDASSHVAASRVAGLPIAERVVRAACRAGYANVLIYSESLQVTKVLSSVSVPSSVRVVGSAQALRAALTSMPADTDVTAVAEGMIPSVALLEKAALIGLTTDQAIVDVATGTQCPRSGIVRTKAAAITKWEWFHRTLATHVPAPFELPSPQDVIHGHAHFVARVSTRHEVTVADRALRLVTYKPTDATLARFNRTLSMPISVALLRTPITANHISLMLVALGVLSGWLFSLGFYTAAVAGAALSLAASILDGCDGEIARLKYQESSLGCWLETIGDYSYYLAILIGLTLGTARSTGWSWLYTCGYVALFGMALSFGALVYLRHTITDGRPETLHSVARARFKQRSAAWSRVMWRLSFVATRAAMPYGIFVLAVVHALPLVLILWAIGANLYWISLALKFRDLVAQPAAPRQLAVGDQDHAG